MITTMMMITRRVKIRRNDEVYDKEGLLRG